MSSRSPYGDNTHSPSPRRAVNASLKPVRIRPFSSTLHRKTSSQYHSCCRIASLETAKKNESIPDWGDNGAVISQSMYSLLGDSVMKGCVISDAKR